MNWHPVIYLDVGKISGLPPHGRFGRERFGYARDRLDLRDTVLPVGWAEPAAPALFPGHKTRVGRRAADMKMRSRSRWPR